jgi:hypothetical protein
MPGKGFADPTHRAKHANVKGRPPGSAGIIGQAIRAHEKDVPAIMDRIFQLALDDDTNVATPHLHFIAARCWPVPKPTDHPQPFTLPDDVRPGDLDTITLSVLRAVAEGKMDPTSAAKICSSIVSHTHLVSTKDVQRLSDEMAELRAMFQGKPATINSAPANDPVEAWSMEPGDPTSTPNGADDD